MCANGTCLKENENIKWKTLSIQLDLEHMNNSVADAHLLTFFPNEFSYWKYLRYLSHFSYVVAIIAHSEQNFHAPQFQNPPSRKYW